jgi:hypothetical protein
VFWPIQTRFGRSSSSSKDGAGCRSLTVSVIRVLLLTKI